MKKANGAQSTKQTGNVRVCCHPPMGPDAEGVGRRGRWNWAPNPPHPQAETAWRGPWPLSGGCTFHLVGLPKADQGVLVFSPLGLLASLLPFLSPPSPRLGIMNCRCWHKHPEDRVPIYSKIVVDVHERVSQRNCMWNQTSPCLKKQ